MRLILTLIAAAILILGLTQKCGTRQPLFDVGYTSTGTPQEIHQKSKSGDNSLTIIKIDIIYPETTAVRTFLGDTLYLKIKLSPDTIK